MRPKPGTTDVGAIRGGVSPSEPFSLTLPAELFEALVAAVTDIVIERLAAAEPSRPYLDSDEAAAFLCCKRKRILDLTSQRRLPVVKDGSRNLYHRADLVAYLESQS